MREFNLKDVGSPELFQKLCEELLAAEYPDFRAIDDTKGDKGCDGLAENGRLFFQMYYPDQSGSFSSKMKRIKRKIRESLCKLTEPYPPTWILFTSENVPLEVHQFAQKKAPRFEGMRIEIWSEPKVMSLLHKYEGIERSWIRKIYGEEYEVILPESVAFNVKNDFPKLLELDRKLGMATKDWKYGQHYEQVHQYTSAGRASILLRPLHANAFEECPITLQGRFRFDNSEEAQAKLKQLMDIQALGERLELDQRFIDELQLKVGDTIVRDFQQRSGPAKLVVEPIPRPPKICDVQLFGKNRIQIRRIKEITLDFRKEQDKILLESREHQKHPFRIRVVVDRSTLKADFNVGIATIECDAMDGYEYAQVLLDFERSALIRVSVRDLATPFDFVKKRSQAEGAENIVRLSKMVKEIQDLTGVRLKSLFSQGAEETRPDVISFVHTVVLKGRTRRKISTLSIVLKNISAQLAEHLCAGRDYQCRMAYEMVRASLLGVDLELGPMTSYFKGKLAEESSSVLREAIVQGSIEGTEVKIVPAPGESDTEDFYHWWLRDAEAKIAQCEKQPRLSINSDPKTSEKI